MNVVLIRVGIDSGSGGTQGPIFKDGSFEFVPIPENKQRDPGKLTYRTARGPVTKKPLSEFVPARLHDRKIHDDPEWRTFTYGDPNNLKRRLRLLESGDLVAFYCGLHESSPGGNHEWPPRKNPPLYLIGYFEVEIAGLLSELRSKLSNPIIEEYFGENFHVKYRKGIDDPNELVLVKGNPNSRLLKRAVCISQPAEDRAGKPTKVLSDEMRKHHFGDLKGRLNITRSGPRWVTDSHVEKAAKFLRGLK